jgi:hypothetical protein
VLRCCHAAAAVDVDVANCAPTVPWPEPFLGAVWCTLSCCGASSHIQHGSAVTGGHRVPHSEHMLQAAAGIFRDTVVGGRPVAPSGVLGMCVIRDTYGIRVVMD